MTKIIEVALAGEQDLIDEFMEKMNAIEGVLSVELVKGIIRVMFRDKNYDFENIKNRVMAMKGELYFMTMSETS